jgi:hypothetical protein
VKKLLTTFLAVLLGLGLTANRQAWSAEGGLTFHLSCDGSPDAGFARGKAQAARKGNIEFVPGYRGQGLRLHPGASLAYDNADNFNPAVGTLMFRFKPEWKTNGAGNMVFFRNRVMDCYRTMHSKGQAHLQIRINAGGKYVVNQVLPDLPTGKWIHAAVTWDCTGGVAIYFDGEARESRQATWTPSLPSGEQTFSLSAPIAPGEAEGATGILDDYRLYDRALTAAEIKLLCLGGGDTPTPAREPVFYAGFEDNTRAALRGKPLAGQNFRTSYEAGAYGKGLRIARIAYDQKGFLRYEGVSALAPATTVSFYFRPEWQVDDGNRHELLQFLAEGKSVSLEKTAEGKMALRFRAGEDSRELLVPAAFPPNGFVRVVMAWNEEQNSSELTVNGKTITATEPFPIRNFFAGEWELMLGAFTQDNFTGDAADGVFDELKIFEGALTLEELQEESKAGSQVTLTAIQPNMEKMQTPAIWEEALAFYAPGARGMERPLQLALLPGKEVYGYTGGVVGTEGTFSCWNRAKAKTRVTLLALNGEAARCQLVYDPHLAKVNLMLESGSQKQALASLDAVLVEEWNHYAVCWQGDGLVFYLNGVRQAVSRDFAFAPGAIKSFGYAAAGIDTAEICAWRRNLTEDELCALFNAGTNPAYIESAPSDYERDCWSFVGADRRRSATGEQICLSGVWRIHLQPDGNLLPPPDQGKYYSQLPGRWTATGYSSVFDAAGKPLADWHGTPLKECYRGWYTRYVEIPADYHDARVYLSATYLGARTARIYVNNELVRSFAETAPGLQDEVRYLQADLTRFRDLPRVKVDVFLSQPEQTSRWNTADASLLDVALEKRPELFTVNPVVRPSVKNQSLTFLCTLANPLRQARRITLAARIYNQDGSVAGESEPQTVDLTGAAGQDVTFRHDWKEGKPWSPSNPVLYDYRLVIRDEGGQMLDESFATRFGFREFELRDSAFRLNGNKFHSFYCSSSDGNWFRYSQYYGVHRDQAFAAVKALKDAGFNTIGVRFSFDGSGGLGRSPVSQRNVLDAADELGMLVVLWAPELRQHMDLDQYRESVANFTRVWGNHPSVCFYLLTFNNCHYPWAEQPSKVDDLTYEPPHKKEARDLARQANQIYAEIDPSRVVWHNASGNLTELYTTMHYLSFGVPLQEREDWPRRWAETRKTAFMSAELGFPYQEQFFDFDYPERRGPILLLENTARYFGDAAYRLAVGEAPFQAYTDNQYFYDDLKLRPAVLAIKSLFARNHLRAWRGYDVSGLGIFAEETAMFRQVYQNRSESPGIANLKTWGVKPDKMHMEHRFKDLSQASEYAGVLADCLAPVLVTIGGSAENFNEKDHAYYVGEEITKQAIIINDTEASLVANLRVALLAADGVVLQEFTQALAVAPGEVYKHPFTVTAPAADQRASCRLVLEVNQGDTRIGQDEFSLQIFPRRQQPLALSSRIGLYDKSGKTRALLEKAGVTFRDIATLADLDGVGVLVVGRETLGTEADPLLRQIENSGLIDRGLNLLVLAQKECNFANLLYEQESQRYAFIRARSHPAFQGLADEDFVNWRGAADLIEPVSIPDEASQFTPHYPQAKWKFGNGGIVATYTVRIPQFGDFTPLLECGFDLLNSPLLELIKGRGRVLLCQLDITERYGIDPVATRVTDNILTYLDAAPPAPTEKNVAYYGEDNSVWQALADSGTACVRLKELDNLAVDSVLIVATPDAAKLEQKKQHLQAFVESGGTVVYFPASGSTPDWTTFPVRYVTDEVFQDFPVAEAPLLAGLGSAAFYWRTKKAVTRFEGVEKLTETGILARRSQGKGEYIFCGIAPEKFLPVPYNVGKREYISFIDQEIQQKAQRIIMTLLHNLGVRCHRLSLFGNERFMHNRRNANDRELNLDNWVFSLDPLNEGVAAGWMRPEYDISSWKKIQVLTAWEHQGYAQDNPHHDYGDDDARWRPGGESHVPYDGYAWYRTTAVIPAGGVRVMLRLGCVDDIDWTYVNGVQVGHIGKETDHYWGRERLYEIPREVLRPGESNVIAVRVLDIHGSGGLTRAPLRLEIKADGGKDQIDASFSPYVKMLPAYDLNAFHQW